MNRRGHHRVRLRFPARLRWTTPFEQKSEHCETIDVCRSGLLLACKESHGAGVPVWVTFPYDPFQYSGQPETPARVIRCCEMHEAIGSFNARAKHSHEAIWTQERSAKPNQIMRALEFWGAPATFAVGLRFEEKRRSAFDGNGHRGEPERRRSPRRALALPIRVRPEQIPWFEETMTIDVSAESIRFQSTRDYEPGQFLIVSFDPPGSSPWPAGKEYRSLVVRVETVPESSALGVSVSRLQ